MSIRIGIFGKYMAARRVSSGPGGSDSGDDGSGLVLFFAFVGGTMAVFLLLGYVLTGIGSLIYDTVRPVLLIAPEPSVIAGGVLIGSILVTIPGYSPETAKRILTSENTEEETNGFYIRNLMVVGPMSVVGFIIVNTGGGWPRTGSVTTQAI